MEERPRHARLDFAYGVVGFESIQTRLDATNAIKVNHDEKISCTS